MRKILLISDTHGKLDLVNELALQTKADLVIHAGDFGFYDERSAYRLSHRELRLLITHSALRNDYTVNAETKRDELIDIVKRHNLFGDFSDYISGSKKFIVPVYAVYGNHEDVQVLKKISDGTHIPNLFMLDENNFYTFENSFNELEFSLYGLGGNFLMSKKLFDAPIAGRCGKVWSTLHQFGVLYKNVIHKEKPSIFVSHVSPGKEPLLTRLITNFMPTFWISGHMGAPFACVWNQFTIRELNEALNWFNVDISIIEEQFNQGLLSEEALIAFEVIKRDIPKKDYWFKKCGILIYLMLKMDMRYSIMMTEGFHWKPTREVYN